MPVDVAASQCLGGLSSPYVAGSPVGSFYVSRGLSFRSDNDAWQTEVAGRRRQHNNKEIKTTKKTERKEKRRWGGKVGEI